jgi:hypothetical protein
MDIDFEGVATKVNIWWFNTGERMMEKLSKLKMAT